MNIRLSNACNIYIALYENTSAADHRSKRSKITEKYFITGNVFYSELLRDRCNPKFFPLVVP